MKIKLLSDILITYFISEEFDSEEEFHSKDEIFDELEFLGMSTTINEKYKFASFQNDDSSVFSLEIGSFEVLESCEEFDEEISK